MAKRKKSKSKAAAILIAALLAAVIIAAILIFVFKPELFHKYLGIGGHSWGEWESSAASCLEDGEKTRVCSVCGEKQSEVIPAVGSHSGEFVVTVPPTCGKAGVKARHCTVCGADETQTIPATGQHQFGDDGKCSICGQTAFEGNAEGAAQSGFSMHIIDLGRYAGDSIYIKAGSNDILIDAGSRQNSAPLIDEYLSKYVTDGKLEYVIATHADQDHIAAFVGSGSGANRTGILYKYKVGTFIQFDYVKSGKQEQTLYNNYLAAVEHARQDGASVFTASQCYDLKGGAQRQYWLNEEHTLSMNILYNYYYYHQSKDNENEHSVVTLFTHETSEGKKHYLFTGDLEGDGESRMVDYYSDPNNSKSEYDVLPDVDFYKAGHHGSKTSSSLKLLNVIKPEYVAISCCAGAPEYTVIPDNVFPTRTAMENILKFTPNVYVTGIATDVPALDEEGNFGDKEWGYTPYNGNIVFYFNSTGQAEGKPEGYLRLYCDNSFLPITQSDWYKKYRQTA